MKRFVDLLFRGALNEDNANVLKELGYVALASPYGGQEINGIKVVKLTLLRHGKAVEAHDDVLKVFVISRGEEIKITSTLKAADVIEIRGKALSHIGAKALKKLASARKPVGIPMIEVIDSLMLGGSVDGLLKLLAEYMRGSIDVLIGSGASKAVEAIHPYIYVAVLVDLGLSEAHASYAVFDSPMRILRGVVRV
ncbi:MAG: hypothetical protein J7L55_04185 [Desulfurococcales archaeon]|nr:hypothetical protein [Desulfurococcales archaeon]